MDYLLLCPNTIASDELIDNTLKVYVQRDYDPRIIREQVNQQRLVAENNLARLHKQTLGSEFDVVNYEHATKQRNPVPEIAPGFVHPQVILIMLAALRIVTFTILLLLG